MRTALIIALIAIASCAIDREEQQDFLKFQEFCAKYGKNYESLQEYLARFKVFRQNLRRMEDRADANAMFIEGVTKFSDLTPNEFRRTYLNLDVNVLNTIHFEEAEPILHFGAEENFDWLDVLNPVKNQGSCGSCWAFSTVANLEGLYYIKYGQHKRFSEQMLVDCDTTDSACNGGLMEYAFDWIKSNGGLMLEGDYAYTGKKGTCKSDSSKYAVKVTGYKKLSSDDETDILNYLVETGPLAIAVNADPLQNYNSGIASYSKSTCDPSGINHAVNLVGYGVENGTKYWLVRNSWGADWGEDGYFRMLRGSGTCGINTYITSATIQ